MCSQSKPIFSHFVSAQKWTEVDHIGLSVRLFGLFEAQNAHK